MSGSSHAEDADISSNAENEGYPLVFHTTYELGHYIWLIYGSNADISSNEENECL